MGNIDTMPDLPLSPRPNMVTKQGLTSIDSALEAAGVASLPPRLVTGDREVLVKAGRDPEYFRMPKAIAKVPDERTPSVSLSNRSDQAIEAPRCPGSTWYASGM